MSRSLFLRLLLLSFFTITFALSADTVTLNNGEKLEGDLFGQSKSKIYLRVNGKVMVILRENIREFRYSETSEEVKKREKIKQKIQEARKTQEKLKNEQRQSDDVEQTIKKLETDLEKEEAKQKQDMERRKALAAELEEEKRKLEEERRQLEAEKRKLAEEKRHAEEERLKRENNGEEESEPVLTTFLTSGHLWRSALVPGWGQYYKGDKVKGGAFFLAMFTATNLLFHAHQSQAVAEADLESAGTLGIVGAASRLPVISSFALSLESDANQRSKLYSNRRFYLSLITIGIYAYNLYDAYSQGASVAPEEQAAKRFRYAIMQKTEFINGQPDHSTAIQFTWSY